MASYEERLNFISDVISYDLLDDAIEWIKGNLHPEEVFDDHELKQWAEDNNFTEIEED